MACIGTGLPIGTAASTAALVSPVGTGKTGWIRDVLDINSCRQLCRHARQLLGLLLLLLLLNLLLDTRAHQSSQS